MKAERQHRETQQTEPLQSKRQSSRLSFADDRPQTVCQAKLINSIQEKENKTGLPDDLKNGIENLSSYSTDDIRVYCNSDKSTQLEDGANALGEKEVQQKFINNNQLSQKPRIVDTIQRVCDWKKNIDGILDAFVNELDRITLEGAGIALASYLKLPIDNPKNALWIEAANEIVEKRKSGSTFQLPDFLHARYGYAVEEYVNNSIDSLRDKLPNQREWRISTQVSFGSTRPDFVVYHLEGDKWNDVGWFDVTSRDSVDHVFDKSGAGWKSKRYIAEILYEPLNILKINPGSISQQEMDKINDKYKKMQIKWEKFISEQKERFESLKRSSSLEKESATTIFFRMYSQEYTIEEAKSILRAIGIIPTIEHGFRVSTRGYTRTVKGGTISEGKMLLQRTKKYEDFFKSI